MVKGIDIFQEYFNEYTDQYVLIGGAACSAVSYTHLTLPTIA